MEKRNAARASLAVVLLMVLLWCTPLSVLAQSGTAGTTVKDRVGTICERFALAYPAVDTESAGDTERTGFVYDKQPVSNAQVVASIAMGESPRWAAGVDESIMPAGWRCEAFTDAETGAVYWTLVSTPVLLRATGVDSYAALVQAINDEPDGGEIHLSGSIALEDTLVIGKSLTFLADSEVSLTVSGAFRHITLSGDSALTFQNIILDGEEIGGGIVSDGFDLTLSGAAIVSCLNATGGGIYFANGNLAMDNCAVNGNTATKEGGGVFAENAVLTLEQNAIDKNTAAGSGGGIGAIGEDAIIHMKSGSVDENSALPMITAYEAFYGGGIYTRGKLILEDGSISHNVLQCYIGFGTTTATPDSLNGAGVYAWDMEMNGGEISYNRITGDSKLSQGGGGVDINRTMILRGGVVAYNKVEAVAGGRFALGGGIRGGVIIMTGGKVHNNDIGEAPSGSRGGGITVNRGSWVHITGGEIYENNATWGGGIYINAFVAQEGQENSVITGDTRIYNNTATYGAGIEFFNNVVSVTMRPVISGNVKITGNVAKVAGGGVFIYPSLESGYDFQTTLIEAEISGNVEISGNISGNYGGGLDIRIHNPGNAPLGAPLGILTISGDVKIHENSAVTGGGILVSACDLTLRDRVEVSGNTATDSGGGIRQSAVTSPYQALYLKGAVRVTDNAAGSNGGGIYSNGRMRIFCDAGVVFARNSAVTGYAWELDGAATAGDGTASGTHMETILTNKFTAPFTNAYNNFDINYTADDAQKVYPASVTVNFYRDAVGGALLGSRTVNSYIGANLNEAALADAMGVAWLNTYRPAGYADGKLHTALPLAVDEDKTVAIVYERLLIPPEPPEDDNNTGAQNTNNPYTGSETPAALFVSLGTAMACVTAASLIKRKKR